jgi:RND family efflux transporter MFP subunit
MIEKEKAKEPELRNAGPARGIVISIIVLAVVAAIVVSGIVPRIRAKDALRVETDELAIPIVDIIHPKPGAPQSEIILPGNMQAFIDSPIYARTNGYLKKWYVDIGARVKTGQLLAEIETPELDRQLDQARSDLKTAQANLNLSQITEQRYEELKNTEAVSKQDVDNAHGDYEAKYAMVASAESNVKRLEQLQSFEKIYAPFDGVITARNTDIGALIDSGAAGGTAKELFHLASMQTLRVYVNVPEQYSQVAKPGLSADITLAEFSGRRFKGKLVRTADSIDAASRTLLVEVDVDNSSAVLLPGAYASVHLKLPAKNLAFLLPVSSLIFRSEGLQIATVHNGNEVTLLPIALGRDFGTEVEVVSGLTESDLVITNPPDSLVSGEKVRIAESKVHGAN